MTPEEKQARKVRSEIRRLVKIGLEGGHLTTFTLRQLVESGVSVEKVRKYMILLQAAGRAYNP